MELLESRIYTFVDSTKRFAFYFLEGQQLIQELASVSYTHLTLPTKA